MPVIQSAVSPASAPQALVVLGAPSAKSRTMLAASLLDRGFDRDRDRLVTIESRGRGGTSGLRRGGLGCRP